MISATLNDAWVRTEHYLRKSSTEFYQVGGTWDQDVTDKFRFTLLGGLSKSNADIPVETTVVFDDRDAQGYSYDYSDMKHPKLTFGTSVTDPANFQLAEIRDRPSNTTNRFKTAQLRTEWDAAEGLTVKVGSMWRRFDFKTVGYQRDTAVCGNGGKDLVLGTITCSPTSLFGPSAVYGFQATPELSELFTLGKAGQPSGTTTQWLIPNLDTATAYTKLYDRALALDVGNNRSVREEVTGGYFQFDAKGDLFGLEYALNAGMRYAKTDQRSTGLNGGIPVTIKRSYEDWLPAANLALFPTDKLVIRAAVADVMTRPTLGSLTPGGSADGFQYRVSYGNPYLNPYRATAYDLAVEWYFAPQSLFSVALFKKDVQSFPVAATISNATFAETGLPASVLVSSSPAALNPALQAEPIWTIATTVNGTGASLKGAEIALQLPTPSCRASSSISASWPTRPSSTPTPPIMCRGRRSCRVAAWSMSRGRTRCSACRSGPITAPSIMTTTASARASRPAIAGLIATRTAAPATSSKAIIRPSTSTPRSVTRRPTGWNSLSTAST